MSIVCTEAHDGLLLPGYSGYVWATIDPLTVNQMPFPSNYKYSSCLLTRKYAHWADRIQNFTVRPDDIWVCGYFKSGTLNFLAKFPFPN